MSYLESTTGLAPFACLPAKSRGRLFAEPESATRDCFQRDRDRIIHSIAFRRLEYKTQVFVNHEGDHFRTRLTHTLEVAQIARSIARYLRLNEDLAEALALAHDLGHPPFGHAGEDALSGEMQSYGGFDHNAQSLKVVTSLERRYPAFDGLNLTWETLEGIVKHNGPLVGHGLEHEVPRDIREYNDKHDLELGTYASAEAQVAALADDIAYNNHDLDDGLRAGLFTVADLMNLPLVGRIFRDIEAEYTNIDPSVAIHEAIRRMIGEWVEDCITESLRRVERVAPKSVEELRTLADPVIASSFEMKRCDQAIRAFLWEHMYRHYKVNRMTSKARRVVRDLFRLLLAEPTSLPTEWQKRVGKPGDEQTARTVADYIGGMTDRFAIDEHVRLIDIQAKAS
jgi:dGTPase